MQRGEPDESRSRSASPTLGVPAVPTSGTHAAYDALHGGAMLVDRSARARATFAGAGAVEVLDGLLTNDVAALGSGSGAYAALLTPKGKIVADVRLFARREDVLVDVPPRAAAGWWAAIRKYVNPRQARYVDVSGALHDIGVYGPRAVRLLQAVTGVDEAEWHALAPYAHREVGDGDGRALVARVPDLGVPGFELFASPATTADLAERLRRAGAVDGTDEAAEVARVEAGRPEWGIDMDDSTLAQEANLDALHAISYTKGCYTGQETVARVHFRGHVNRHLRGLLLSGDPMPPRGTPITDVDGAAIGDIRSTVRSPRLGPIALAMLRREAAPDAEVVATWEGGSMRGRVVALPFPA